MFVKDEYSLKLTCKRYRCWFSLWKTGRLDHRVGAPPHPPAQGGADLWPPSLGLADVRHWYRETTLLTQHYIDYCLAAGITTTNQHWGTVGRPPLGVRREGRERVQGAHGKISREGEVLRKSDSMMITSQQYVHKHHLREFTNKKKNTDEWWVVGVSEGSLVTHSLCLPSLAAASDYLLTTLVTPQSSS